MGQDSNASEDLLRRAAADDEAALAALWERHRARLRPMVRPRLDRRLQGRVDPSDVLQGAYLDLAARPGDSARERPMPAYLWMRLVTGPRLIQAHRQHLGAARRDREGLIATRAQVASRSTGLPRLAAALSA